MAKKTLPPPSSSEDEEDKSSSDDDEEEEQIPSKPVPRTPSKPESDDSETDTSDTSDSETEPAPQKIQTIPSQPAPQSKSGSDSASESESDHESTKLVTPISSKLMATPVESDPVVKSSDTAGVNNSSKLNGKALFQRVWSLDDEITIIEAIAEYQSEHGPIKIIPTGIGGFYDFVKGRLSSEVTGTQLADKIRSLKKKYSSVAGWAKEGKSVKFAKSRDEKLHKLSEKLWGKGNEEDWGKGKEEAEAGITVNGRGRKGKRQWPLLKDTLGSMGNKMIVGELLEGIDGQKAGVWERKLKKQKRVEVKHQIARADLIKESIKLVLEGLERAEY